MSSSVQYSCNRQRSLRPHFCTDPPGALRGPLRGAFSFCSKNTRASKQWARRAHCLRLRLASPKAPRRGPRRAPGGSVQTRTLPCGTYYPVCSMSVANVTVLLSTRSHSDEHLEETAHCIASAFAGRYKLKHCQMLLPPGDCKLALQDCKTKLEMEDVSSRPTSYKSSLQLGLSMEGKALPQAMHNLHSALPSILLYIPRLVNQRNPTTSRIKWLLCKTLRLKDASRLFRRHTAFLWFVPGATC